MAASFGGFRAISQTAGSSLVSDDDEFCTLTEYVGKGGANVGDDLVILFDHLQYACKKIAALVASPYNSSLGKISGGVACGDGGASGRDKPKPLDIVTVGILYYLTENLI